MKRTLIMALACLSTTLAVPASAEVVKAIDFRKDDGYTVYKPKPDYSNLFKERLLYPVPKPKIPGIGPLCLSCPPDVFRIPGRVVILPYTR
ncbi:MAG: hypothetical protein AAF748_05275 [Pseudomonadota bacterium]